MLHGVIACFVTENKFILFDAEFILNCLLYNVLMVVKLLLTVNILNFIKKTLLSSLIRAEYFVLD